MNESILKTLAKSGPWAVLAGVLLMFFLWEVRPSIAALKAEHAEMRAEEAAESAQIEAFMERVVAAMETSNYLQRRECVNSAKTFADRDACAKNRD